MSPNVLARLRFQATQPAGIAPVIDSPELAQLLRERDAALVLLHQLSERLYEEHDIGWHGEPNLAMRITNDHGNDIAMCLARARE